MKHQRVQRAPVAVRARFWVREREEAGRAKSETPVRTTHHFRTGALESELVGFYK